jgi:hypothetical protein
MVDSRRSNLPILHVVQSGNRAVSFQYKAAFRGGFLWASYRQYFGVSSVNRPFHSNPLLGKTDECNRDYAH